MSSHSGQGPTTGHHRLHRNVRRTRLNFRCRPFPVDQCVFAMQKPFFSARTCCTATYTHRPLPATHVALRSACPRPPPTAFELITRLPGRRRRRRRKGLLRFANTRRVGELCIHCVTVLRSDVKSKPIIIKITAIKNKKMQRE